MWHSSFRWKKKWKNIFKLVVFVKAINSITVTAKSELKHGVHELCIVKAYLPTITLLKL